MARGSIKVKPSYSWFYKSKPKLLMVLDKNHITYRSDKRINMLIELLIGAACDRGICWENTVGQEFFKLTLLDLAVFLTRTFVNAARCCHLVWSELD
mgnify:CR=1 FL=1